MSQTSSLPTFSDIFAFGDSLSDAGNLSITTTATGSTQPVSPPYFQEQYGSISGNIFSNGPTWVQNLSIALGLGTLKPSLIGGTDFAFGGAETGTTPQNAGDLPIMAISLPAQFTQFQAAVPNPSATALYTLSIGANDVLDILANPGLTTQQQTTDVNDAVANEISFVKQLASDGAMNLLVLDVPDLGKTPDVTQGLANGSNMPSAALTACQRVQHSSHQPARHHSRDQRACRRHLPDGRQCRRRSGGLGADECHLTGVERQLYQSQQRHARGYGRRRAGPIPVLGSPAPDRDRPSGNRRRGRAAT